MKTESIAMCHSSVIEVTYPEIVGVDYLVETFTVEQLRKHIENADINLAIARCFGTDDEVEYQEAFLRQYNAALEVIKARKPKVSIQPGHFSVRAIKEASNIIEVINRYTKLRKTGKEYIQDKTMF